MVYSKYFISLIFFSFLFFGCNKKTSPPPDKNTTNNEPIKGDDEKIVNLELKGKWSVTSFPYKDRILTPKVSYTVEFTDNNLGIQLEVNACGTSYSFTDNAITIKEVMSCTEACCDSEEGQALTRLFSGELKYSIIKNVLIITTAQGPIRLEGGKTDRLSGTSWLAKSYAGIKDGKQIKFTKEYTLNFKETKILLHLDANSCNTTCSFLNKEAAFEVPTTSMSCTRKCCDSEDGKLLMQSLQGKITYKKEGENLVLKTFNKIIIFTPKKGLTKD